MSQAGGYTVACRAGGKSVSTVRVWYEILMIAGGRMVGHVCAETSVLGAWQAGSPVRDR